MSTERKKSIVFLMADAWACGLYRCYMPALWMNKTGLANAYCSFHGAKKGKMPMDYSLLYGHVLENIAGLLGHTTYVSEEELYAEFTGVDTVVYQRQDRPIALDHLKFMKSIGKKVYCEFDDKLTGHPIKATNKYWQSPERVRLYTRMCEEATGVIVTNEVLGDDFKKFNSNVIVLKNNIDCSQYIDKRSDLSIGFAGSPGHKRDFKYLGYTLTKLSTKYPIRFMGCSPDGIKADKIASTDLKNYPLKLSGAFSVGVAPLIRDSFSDCKSSIKWLEYSMSGIATIAEDFGPFKRDIGHGEDGYLANRNWETLIDNLMKDDLERERIVRNAQERIRKEFSIENNINDWAKIL